MGLRRDDLRWTTPGGHLDGNEDPRLGALRELKEETGIEADREDLFFLGRWAMRSYTGKSLRIFCFQISAKPEWNATASADPDREVHGWHFVGMDAFPPGIRANLHSPKNALLCSLGLEDPDSEMTRLRGIRKLVRLS